LPYLTSLDTGKKDRLASLALGQSSHRRTEYVYFARRHTSDVGNIRVERPPATATSTDCGFRRQRLPLLSGEESKGWPATTSPQRKEVFG
jgi:hypothetical protein